MATNVQFRPEAGFADARGLLAALSRDERAEIMALVEQDLRKEYEQKAQDAAAAHAAAEAARLAAEADACSRWREEFGGGIRREIEASLATLAAQTTAIAVLMAEKLVRREVTVDRGVLERALATVLYKVEAGCVLQVTAHPDDAAWLLDHPELRDQLRVGEVKSDRRLERGGALVKAADTEWDVTVERQLGVLSETLDDALALPADVPEGPHPSGDDHA
ncbi:MAG: FliH/SctL family protein [Candidatus Krumholzibacteriia bacterium]